MAALSKQSHHPAQIERDEHDVPVDGHHQGLWLLAEVGRDQRGTNDGEDSQQQHVTDEVGDQIQHIRQVDEIRQADAR